MWYTVFIFEKRQVHKKDTDISSQNKMKSINWTFSIKVVIRCTCIKKIIHDTKYQVRCANGKFISFHKHDYYHTFKGAGLQLLL